MGTVVGVRQIDRSADRVGGIIQPRVDSIIRAVLPIGGSGFSVAGTVFIAVLGVEQWIEQRMRVECRLWRLGRLEKATD